ncbi:MAG TPA: hypothetical protein PKA27_12285 [Fimbriimonadaceae bacterium]|nr:hypothetical protein [Fimbriimonadaceae bacterium]
MEPKTPRRLGRPIYFETLSPNRLGTWLFATLFGIFVLAIPFFVFLVLKSHPDHMLGHNYGDGPRTIVWYLDAESGTFVMLGRAATFSVAMAMGALGACISLLLRMDRSDLLKIPLKPVHVWIVQSAGATFGLLALLLFLGGFISGSLFPGGGGTFGFFTSVIYGDGMAKLMVWCFVAGFSERLMPSLIRSLEERVVLTEATVVTEDPEPATVTIEATIPNTQLPNSPNP